MKKPSVDGQRAVIAHHQAPEIPQPADGALDEQLQQKARADPHAPHLMSIRGIGAYSALLLKAAIGDVRRFASKRQLYSYAGLVPRLRQLGMGKRAGGITRAGSPRLRWILVEASMNAV